MNFCGTVFLSALLFSVPFAGAQDMSAMQAAQDATQAAQMASQQAIQANQQAMQAAQQANQDAMQAAQQANQDALNSGPCCGVPFAATPRFSVKAGSHTSAIQVRLTDRTRGAVVYYTTDGWTPTMASARYMGPIAISSTTTIQAIAVAPGCSRSLVATAVYTFPAAPAPALPSAEILPLLPSGSGLVLRLDTPVRLEFSSPVDSHTAQVGDKISLTLAEDLKSGDTVVAPKGTPATGRVLQVDHAGMAGMPGEIVFQVESLNLNGAAIPLRGSAALEGKPEVGKARGIAMIPGVGMGGLLVHGQEAQIVAGTALTATMIAGTVLPGPVS